MTTRVLTYVSLTDRERKAAGTVGKLRADDVIELRIKRASGEDEVMPIPASVTQAFVATLDELIDGTRVVLLAEDHELTPKEASEILGMSRPLVVHRMDLGDLPFRYVGKHRRTKLKDVLVLKEKIDAQHAALDELADVTEALMRDHGL